jgi:hypothetical protein
LDRSALSASSTSTTCGKSKGLMRVALFKAKPYISAAHGIAHFLVFVFRVDNKNFGAEHHRPQGFQLNCKAFAGAGFGKDYAVAVFQAETVKNDQAGIMHVDAVQNAVVLCQVGAEVNGKVVEIAPVFMLR